MKIIIVGTGNVAHEMGKQFGRSGLNISKIIGRNLQRTKELADVLNCSFSLDFSEKDEDGVMYIIAVSDQSIERVSKKIKNKSAIQIHTSGSVNMNVLGAETTGVVWPLYSINRNVDTDWKKVPLITEYSNNAAKNAVERITEALSGPTYLLDSTQRAHAHLLAVFINNFSLHLFQLVKDHQAKLKIDPEMYQGILNDTIEKISHGDIKNTLTGPARRNDKITMKKHLQLLSEFPDLKSLYELFSQSIINTYNGEKL